MGKLLASILFFATLPSFGQNQVRFDRITVEDGLSQSSITSMVQDEFGYLWIGTLDGLNKYDGNNFYKYKSNDNDSTGLPRNEIKNLFLDNTKNVWISTPGYLSKFFEDQNSFINYALFNDGSKHIAPTVYDLNQESDSILILATNTGIWRLNVINKLLKRSHEFDEFDDKVIFNYCSMNNGDTWIVTDENAYLRRNNKMSFKNVFSSKSPLEFYYSQRTDEVYMQTIDSLYKFDSTLKQFFPLFHFSNKNSRPNWQMPMLKLRNGELWVLRNDISIFNSRDHYQETVSFVQEDPFSLSSDYLSSIFETKEGVVWIGTNGMGLNKYSPQLSIFNYYGYIPGAPLSLSNNYIVSITTNNDSTIYVATTNGLDIINLKDNRTTNHKIIAKNGNKVRISKITLDDSGNVWMATTHGLVKWDGFQVQFIYNAEIESSKHLNDLFFISPQELIVASNKNIVRFNTQTNSAKKIVSTGTLIMHLANDKLWTESFNSIIEYDTINYAPINHLKYKLDNTKNFPDVNIKSFYKDSESNIWIGTSGAGLVLYENDSLKRFTEKDGLPNNVIYGILEDNLGHLWLSTNKGIAVFDKKEYRVVKIFYGYHGLQGDEFNTKAYFKSPSGKMYFGGVSGLTSFLPTDALEIASEIPKAILTGLFINGQKQKQTLNSFSLSQIVETGKVELDWNERNFGFEVSSLGFSYPAHTSYQYKLEGYENIWTFIEKEHRIQFTNIPPGEYKLRIKASNSFGEWEKEGLVISIIISHPFWRTIWFISTVIVIIVLTITFIFQLRTRGLRKRTQLLEQLVQERTETLQIQQEEIAAQNEELIAQSEIMEFRHAELEKVKSSLEERVKERTIVLQKVNEELVDQNTKLEQFAFITAHNIKGPVAQIKGLVNLIELDDGDIIRHLISSTNDLDLVISDLNTVLNVRMGMGNQSELVELKGQLELVLKILKDEISGIGAKVDISQFRKVKIKGLQPYIYSIFYNLIHNALKYASNERQVVITCSNDIKKDMVQITIADNGVGIDMNYAKDKIFNLYQRFHPEKIGKGFGLFLTRTHIEAMNGSIEVESTLNIGTRFIMEFPISKEAVLKAT